MVEYAGGTSRIVENLVPCIVVIVDVVYLESLLDFSVFIGYGLYQKS